MAFERVLQAIDDIKNGKMIVMVDDEDRENEGDIVFAAAFSDVQKVNFMITHARGVLCTPLSKELADKFDLYPMVGANTSCHETAFTVSIDAMSAAGLSIDGTTVAGDDASAAHTAIDSIKAAIQKVSTQRSALGAVQNRLEHTIANLDNVVENTTAAESQIRDTDMATEMVKYSNNNILAQAGQAMLAQANQSNQGVLSLLG